MKLHTLAWVLVLVGALNWGLIGLLGPNFNVVNMLLGSWPLVERVVYVLVGAAALYKLFVCKDCNMLMGGKKRK